MNLRATVAEQCCAEERDHGGRIPGLPGQRMFKDNVPGLELATDNMKLFQAENKTPNTFGYAQLHSIVDYLKEQTALPALALTATHQVCPVY